MGDPETERRLALCDRRDCPVFSDAELKRLLVAVEHISELRHDVRCVRSSIEDYKPMLDEMIATRANMSKVKWNVISAGAVGILSVFGSLGLFLAFLIWDWAKKQ